ncbi:hypothetical protein SS50377_26162 [Spironucleus salmonicida]|uniref:Uncharacterized protein n=1 Tax=Spironucleus salmonicida TaxID=348837 RepID=V6LJW4_9EUKA|nr:hypothetical protein SS50377_26162 [Spironucleus salmonicida]|eukprot:EST44895.1 Hypothetical protein SS50377_15187 [Spironucleus salmonicida]
MEETLTTELITHQIDSLTQQLEIVENTAKELQSQNLILNNQLVKLKDDNLQLKTELDFAREMLQAVDSSENIKNFIKKTDNTFSDLQTECKLLKGHMMEQMKINELQSQKIKQFNKDRLSPQIKKNVSELTLKISKEVQTIEQQLQQQQQYTIKTPIPPLKGQQIQRDSQYHTDLDKFFDSQGDKQVRKENILRLSSSNLLAEEQPYTNNLKSLISKQQLELKVNKIWNKTRPESPPQPSPFKRSASQLVLSPSQQQQKKQDDSQSFLSKIGDPNPIIWLKQQLATQNLEISQLKRDNDSLQKELELQNNNNSRIVSQLEIELGKLRQFQNNQDKYQAIKLELTNKEELVNSMHKQILNFQDKIAAQQSTIEQLRYEKLNQPIPKTIPISNQPQLKESDLTLNQNKLFLSSHMFLVSLTQIQTVQDIPSKLFAFADSHNLFQNDFQRNHFFKQVMSNKCDSPLDYELKYKILDRAAADTSVTELYDHFLKMKELLLVFVDYCKAQWGNRKEAVEGKISCLLRFLELN